MPSPRVPAATLNLILYDKESGKTFVDPNLSFSPDATHPRPLWFCLANGHPSFQIIVGDQIITLLYLQYQEINGESYLMGTEGKDQPVHFCAIILYPSNVVKGSLYNDCNTDFLNQDPTFNTDLAQAINQVDNPLVITEVM